MTTGTIVGYDPGGNGNHGLALLGVGRGEPRGTSIERHPDVESVVRRIEGVPDLVGVGVDTLTCWSTGPGGWRPADRWLRRTYPEVKQSVVTPNGLYGSMGLGGMAVLLAVRRLHPDVPITETHPKVLHWAIWRSRYDYAQNASVMDAALGTELGLPVHTQCDHEWDAVVSAFAVLRAFRGEWTHDLHGLTPAPGERLVEPCGPTTYAWPE